MRSQSLIFGFAAAGCAYAEASERGGEMFEVPEQAGAVAVRANPTSSYGYDQIRPWEAAHTPKWIATVSPDKISALQKDMHALATSVHNNKLYSSMTAVMATAIPETFKEAMMTNPKSIHKQYKTVTPEWYEHIPADVRSFMESNKKAAKSIFSKDIGPMPTGKHGKEDAHATSSKGAHAAEETGKPKDGKLAKSEADSLRIFGAATAALVGTFGFAMLML